MLRFLRNKKTAKKVWIGLAIIIIPAFALWGFGGASGNRKDTVPVGKIFGRNISAHEFQESLAAVRTSALIQFGEKLPEIEKYLNLESQSWERLILLQIAQERRIRVTDQEVIQAIQDAPYFQDKNGFNLKVYNEALHYIFRTQPRIFEDQMRKNLILLKLYRQITDGIKLTDTEIRQEYLLANEELRIDYIASLLADSGKNLKIKDQEIIDFFEKNKTAFKETPKVNIAYIATDSDLEAKRISAFMKKDYTLEKIAQELKITKKETGLFDPSLAPETLEIPQGILSLILNQKIDVLSPLIAYGKSSYLCVLKEKTTTRIPLLSEIKTKVKDTLTKEITKKTAEAKINNCAEKLKKLEFSQAANTCGLKAKLSPYFKSSGQIPELGSSNIFWENAKKLKTNQVSPILSDANGFYIIKLNALKPLDEEKFNKEKTDFGQKLLQQKQNAEFSKFLDEAKKKAQ